MEIEVLKCNWNNKGCYSGFMKFTDISNIVNVDIDQSMNREVKKERVDKIISYIINNEDRVFFPPVILNSINEVEVNKTHNNKIKLKLLNKSLSIIDGQHRISAIKKIINDDKTREIFKNNSIPFLLLENLEPMEHRDLFNLINDNSANVESTVSARFKITKENYYGLKYTKEDLDKNNKSSECNCNNLIKNNIEWEQKQSLNKICYLYITEVNRILLKYIKKNIRKCDISDEMEYEIIKSFWNKYFDFIKSMNDENKIKSFYVKKVTLKAIVKYITTELVLDEDICSSEELELSNKYESSKSCNNLEMIVNRFEKYLDIFLKSELDINFDGEFKQNNESYKNIIIYLLKIDNKEKYLEDKENNNE